MSPQCGGCGDETDLRFGHGSNRAAACSARHHALWMVRNRILRDISFTMSLPAEVTRPRNFDELDQKIADSLDEAINEYAAAALEGIENPTIEEVAKALSDAIEKALAGTITIDVTVDL